MINFNHLFKTPVVILRFQFSYTSKHNLYILSNPYPVCADTIIDGTLPNYNILHYYTFGNFLFVYSINCSFAVLLSSTKSPLFNITTIPLPSSYILFASDSST